MCNVKVIFVLIVASLLDLSVSRADDWHDPSPHQIRNQSVAWKNRRSRGESHHTRENASPCSPASKLRPSTGVVPGGR